MSTIIPIILDLLLNNLVIVFIVVDHGPIDYQMHLSVTMIENIYDLIEKNFSMQSGVVQFKMQTFFALRQFSFFGLNRVVTYPLGTFGYISFLLQTCVGLFLQRTLVYLITLDRLVEY